MPISLGWLKVPGQEDMDTKKNDDYPSPLPTRRPSRPFLPSTPSRRLVRRVLILMAIIAAISILLRSISSLPFSQPHWRDSLAMEYTSNSPFQTGYREMLITPILLQEEEEESQLQESEPDVPPCQQTYSGPIQFLVLGDTLRQLSPSNYKNIFFAAASLSSAASLLQLACRMGMEGQSQVHFALMGRSEISLEDLQSVNGIDSSCLITFHGACFKNIPYSAYLALSRLTRYLDARPDFAVTSTIKRIEHSVGRALCRSLLG